MHPDTRKYNQSQEPQDREICERLARLAKARDIQWDYRNLARRKGRLERL